MTKQVVTASKGPSESWENFMRRHAVTARQVFHQAGAEGIASRAVAQYWKAAVDGMMKFGEQVVASLHLPGWLSE